MEDGAAAADGLAEKIIAAGRRVDEADTVAVDGAEQHHEAGELEEGFAFRLRAGAELEARGVFENDEQGDLAFLDEFLAVGFPETGGDVPVDVADVVAEGVFDDLVELHAAAAEGGAVFAAEDVFDGVADAPFELAQKGQRIADFRWLMCEGRRHAGRGARRKVARTGRDQAAGIGVVAMTWATILSAVISLASAS